MFRNQASKEALSTANGHSHRSTGIASGLEYRDGYAVGGRVGFKDGTPEPDESILNVNPLFPSLGEIKEYEKKLNESDPFIKGLLRLLSIRLREMLKPKTLGSK